MALRRPIALDAMQTNDLGERIRDLKERIAHLNTYFEDHDTALLEMTLESLIEQHKQEVQQGD